MSWKTARDQIVHIISVDATPTINDHGAPTSFKHAPEAGDGTPGRMREFSLRLVGTGTRAHDPAGARQHFASVEVTVWYPEWPHDRARLDEVIGLDYETIRDALMATTNWDAPTSKIQALGDGSDVFAPADINTSPDGSRELVFQIPLTHE